MCAVWKASCFSVGLDCPKVEAGRSVRFVCWRLVLFVK